MFSSISNILDSKQGWKRVGDDIVYKKNKLYSDADSSLPADLSVGPLPSAGAAAPATPAPAKEPSLYTLSFSFEVPHDGDICYFAFAVPYSYSRLNRMIRQWMSSDISSRHLEVFEMCKTVAGNTCPILRITDERNQYLPLIYLPGEKERMQREKIAEEARRRAQAAVEQQKELERKRKLEESRVFFAGKQKMAPHLGVVPDWEKQLDESSSPLPSPSNGKGGGSFATTEAPIESVVPSEEQKDEAVSEPPSVSVAASVIETAARPTTPAATPTITAVTPPPPAAAAVIVKRSRRLKPVVVVSARVHPGETVSSFMCEGLVQFLLSSSPSAVQLRERAVFLVVPMLNPDGVINGFYRSNLGGADLNRIWDKPSPLLEPTIFR